MSIASEITRLQGVKSDILQAIAAKGVTVPAGSDLDDCPDLIASISGGGGGVPVEYVELEYIQTKSELGGASFLINIPEFTNKDREFSVIFSQEYSIANTLRNFIFIGRNSSAPGFLFNNGSRTSGNFYFQTRNNINDYSSGYIDNVAYYEKCKLSIKNANVELYKYDGTKLDYTTYYSESNLNRLYLMTDRAGQTINPFFGKLYNLSISNVIDLHPVKRVQDNVLGLYDIINNTFYTAQDGQSFIFAGPIKQ